VSVVRVIHPAGGAGAIVQTPSFGGEVDGALDDEGRVRQRAVDRGGTLSDEDGALALGGWGDFDMARSLPADGGQRALQAGFCLSDAGSHCGR
jgi:hypothetical protein